jgi:hypothetical protein
MLLVTCYISQAVYCATQPQPFSFTVPCFNALSFCSAPKIFTPFILFDYSSAVDHKKSSLIIGHSLPFIPFFCSSWTPLST